jgi:hypothetical protein
LARWLSTYSPETPNTSASPAARFPRCGRNATLPIFGQPGSRNGPIPAMSVDRLDMKDRAAGIRS